MTKGINLGFECLVVLVALSAETIARDERRTILNQELPKLKNSYGASPLKGFGKDTPLARTYYELLNCYVPYAQSNLKDWPAEPGAKVHKRDGSLEHSVRQNASVALGFALLAKCGDYDEHLAGVPRTKVLEDAAGLIRYLAVTHAANFLPTGDGKQWGDHWQSAYWTALAGEAAWLVWPDLSDETKVLAARMIIHEADRFNNRPPDDGMVEDTKAEENAWNSEIVALAHCMFSHHPNASLWGERAIVYMMNAYSTAADHQDTRVVDGRPIKDRVTTTCISSDFTVENHRRVHPDYLSAFTLSLHNAMVYRLAGLEVPGAAFHHAEECLDVLQQITATNGTLFYINGQDWWPHQPAAMMEAAGFLNAMQPDPKAAFVEQTALATQKQMHNRFSDGRAFDSRESNYPNPEEDMMYTYVDMCLAHRLFGDGAAPVNAQEFQRAYCGTRILRAAGYVIHRTPEKFVSFCWVNGAMGLIYPQEDTWFTSPYERGLVGEIQVAEAKDDALKVEASQVSRLGIAGRGGDNGFNFGGRISRCEGKVEQRIVVVSLPDAPVMYVEKISARADVEVQHIATAAVSVLNEPAAPGTNERQVWIQAGKQTMSGAASEKTKSHTWKTSWANLDDRLGVVTPPGGQMNYWENHHYIRARLQQVLAANYLPDVGPKKAGDVLSENTVAFIPNAAHTLKLEVHMERIRPNVFMVRLGCWRILANLGDSEWTGEIGAARHEVAALSAVVEEVGERRQAEK